MGLRVGLTGGLGSGKSTVAAMLTQHGAHVLAADEIARGLMVPGERVYAAIVEHFGPGVVGADCRLHRPALARIAFLDGRVEELNAIVHPATIARQTELQAAIFAQDAQAVVVAESALLFETQHGSGWRDRFDRLVLVTAPQWLKVERFVARSGGSAGSREELEAEARRRLSRMIPDEQKAPQCDVVLKNQGSLAELQAQVDTLWAALREKNKT